MKVYILSADYFDEDYETEVLGAFASYSAMKTWLFEKYGYKSSSYIVEDNGEFLDQASLCGIAAKLYFVSYEVIGEHSHKTNTIQFN
ncbi:MAG: hypothetical protein RR744_09300 [Cellulosilyticaceae bacterium]